VSVVHQGLSPFSILQPLLELSTPTIIEMQMITHGRLKNNQIFSQKILKPNKSDKMFSQICFLFIFSKNKENKTNIFGW